MVGNGLFVAQLGPFDTEGFGLSIDPLVSGPLVVKEFVGLRLTVELVTDTSANGGGQGRGAAAFRPLFVIDRTGLAGRLREKEGTNVATTFVFDQGGFLRPEGVFEGHR